MMLFAFGSLCLCVESKTIISLPFAGADAASVTVEPQSAPKITHRQINELQQIKCGKNMQQYTAHSKAKQIKNPNKY